LREELKRVGELLLKLGVKQADIDKGMGGLFGGGGGAGKNPLAGALDPDSYDGPSVDSLINSFGLTPF
jgi:hypothetical protein